MPVLRNVIYFILSALLFLSGVILYGILLNAREVTLREAMQQRGLAKLENVSIIIDRRNYRLGLYSGDLLIKNYKASFGRMQGQKISIFDMVTPTGSFEICYRDSLSQYHRFLGLNYPSLIDAWEELQKGNITKGDYESIVRSYGTNGIPPHEILSRCAIGIQGIGKFNFIFKNLPFVFNWTNGSVALSNEAVDEISAAAPLGTRVKIIN